MESSLLEIVELANGDIILRRADEDGEPLVNIRFSKESLKFMPNIRLDIAKAMIQAGIETFSEMTADSGWQVESDEDSAKVIH